MNPDIFPDEKQKQINEDLAREILKHLGMFDEVLNNGIKKIKQAGYIKESALDKANKIKLNKLTCYYKKHHSDAGYGDNDFDTYESIEMYDIKQVDEKIKLLEQFINENQEK